MGAPAKRNGVEAWRIARQQQKYKSKGAMGCLYEDRTCLWQRWREKDTEDRTTEEWRTRGEQEEKEKADGGAGAKRTRSAR